MASAVTLVGLMGCFASSAKIMDLIVSARQQAAAAHALQERVEQVRSSNWEQVTDRVYITSNDFLGTANSSSNLLPGLTESVTVTPWPPPAGVFPTMMGNRSGTTVTALGDTSLKDNRAVRMDLTMSWMPKTNVRRTYSTSVIVARGGVLR